jgi:hypothetical protein
VLVGGITDIDRSWRQWLRDATALPPNGRGVVMPSSIIRKPANPDDNFKAQQKLEFDRWRTAIAIVERMREAGISCELSNDLQNGN